VTKYDAAALTEAEAYRARLVEIAAIHGDATGAIADSLTELEATIADITAEVDTFDFLATEYHS
jgi:hypothetical protein